MPVKSIEEATTDITAAGADLERAQMADDRRKAEVKSEEENIMGSSGKGFKAENELKGKGDLC